jgi:hypothetical protein
MECGQCCKEVIFVLFTKFLDGVIGGPGINEMKVPGAGMSQNYWPEANERLKGRGVSSNAVMIFGLRIGNSI